MSNGNDPSPSGARTVVPMSDEELVALFQSVETEDFVRHDPPEGLWTSVLVGVRDHQLQEAQAQAPSPSGRLSPPRLMLVAAALLSIVLGGAFLVRSLVSDTTPQQVAMQQVATAEMTDEGLPVATDATATATVVCDDDGACSVEIDLSEMPDAGNDGLELWVINSSVTDMHSLGLIDGSGTYPLPVGVDAAADFPIVDISIEPDDGDATHSGQSVLRGALSST